MDVLEVIKYKRFEARFRVDEDAEDPRQDKIGTIITCHGQYQLGDVHFRDTSDLRDYHANEQQTVRWQLAELLYREPTDEEVVDSFVELPIYMYDHSGLAFSLTPFSCPWDSGQIGVIYANMLRLGKGEDIPRTQEAVKKRLISEFYQWYGWQDNQVYEYSIYDSKTDEYISGCSGFYTDLEAERRSSLLKRARKACPACGLELAKREARLEMKSLVKQPMS